MKKLLLLSVFFTGCGDQYCHYMNEKRQRLNVFRGHGDECSKEIFINGQDYKLLINTEK